MTPDPRETLKEKIAAARDESAIGNCAPVMLAADQWAELLAALDLADAVRWVQDNEARISFHFEGRRTWGLSVKRGDDWITQYGWSLPEAVSALRKKLEDSQ